MKKRIIALVVLMAMVIGMTSQLATAAEAATYEVGYAKVDINPEVNGQWLSVPIAGGAQTTSRLSTGKADDTGDGVVNEDDGIFATCIAITDKNGKTVLLISCDIANAYTPFVEPARQQILAQYASYGLEADRILINASHTHSGPMLVAGWESNTTFGEAYETYKNYLVSQLVKAAGNALADRAPATMYKGSIDASDYAQSTYGEDRAYNTVRHYEITMTGVNDSSKTYTYVCGDNFNDYRAVGETATIDGTTYEVTNVETVTQADDTMQVVKFAFENGNQPIALVNWRAHATISKGRGTVTEGDAYYLISGDYVNALRYSLAQSNYRAAFFQGASGNINPGSKLEAGDWLTNAAAATKHVTYGNELAKVALACLESAEQINEDGGEIRSVQNNYQSARKQVSVFEYMAGWLYHREYGNTSGGINGNRVYEADTMYYYVDENGTPLIHTSGDSIEGTRSAETGTEKIATTEPVVIASIFHANAMIDGYRANSEAGMMLELNAVTIGDFSLVTSAGEPFDYYNNASSQNMWNDVGADFVLGYTNLGGGYISSKETFAFNSGISTMANGSYETMCNNISEGTGEAVVEKLDVMLDFLKNQSATSKVGNTCQHCQKRVEWTELTAGNEMAVSNAIRSGHYYLTGDVTLNDVDPMIGADVCIHPAGYTLTFVKGCTIPGGTTLSIVGNGVVTSTEAAGYGGVFNVKEGATLNLYNATLRYSGEEGEHGVCNSVEQRKGRTIHAGGILYVAGTFNMYSGLVKGTNVYGSGGAMLVTATGVANIRGGEIRDKATNQAFNAGGRSDDCIRNSGKVILSGDANVDEIYIHDASESTTFAWGERLVFEGKYTGSVNVKYSDLSYVVSQDIGDHTDADISLADIKINGAYDREFRLKEDGLLSVEYTAICEAEDKSNPGVFIYSNDPNTLFGTLSADSRVILHQDVDTLTVNNNLHLELKGKTVNSLTVGDGYTVQVTDCKTTDYDVSDGVYGKIGEISGNAIGAPATETSDDYLAITEDDGSTSYHAVDLSINSMSLRTSAMGLYFDHAFKGDAVVKAQIKKFGIAMSLEGAPTEEDLQAEATVLNKYVSKSGAVVYTGFAPRYFGTDEISTSTLVSGIMKTENDYLTNKRNAGMQIYGRAYIMFEDGSCVLGVTRQRSLQEQVQGIDEKLWGSMSQAQKNEILKAYETSAYNQVMAEWTIPNITDPEQEQTVAEQEIIRILGVGNSHTVDATTLLYEVFAKEMPEQKVMIGNMYKSGCTVAEHVSYHKNSVKAYSYFTNEDGTWNEQTETTLKTGLTAEVWDYVMLHEMNVSVIHTKNYTNTNLQTHINNVKSNTIGTPTLLWNFSWANPVDPALMATANDQSWIDCYEDYSQLSYTTMLTQMVNKTQKYVVTNKNISGVAPTGTAICYARNELGLAEADLYRDYTHVSDFGRLISAYVWYATITEQDEITDVKVDVIPAALRQERFQSQGDLTITEEMKNVIIESVNFALKNPWTVTAEK